MGGMHTEFPQQTAKLNHLLPIHAQAFYSCPTCGSDTDNPQSICAPDKVCTPALTTWVEK